MKITIDQIRSVLSREYREIESKRIPSAVIIPIYEKEKDLWVLFIRKTEDGSPHSGQVSFPGGTKNYKDKNLLETALRELYEETGIKKQHIDLLGYLEPVPTKTTNYIIYPFVAFVKNLSMLKADPKEVARIFSVPLSFFIKNYPFRERNYIYKGIEFNTFLLEYNNEIIWGATARILDILISRIYPLIKSKEVRQ